jgi:hypothetical protein
VVITDHALRPFGPSETLSGTLESAFPQPPSELRIVPLDRLRKRRDLSNERHTS